MNLFALLLSIALASSASGCSGVESQGAPVAVNAPIVNGIDDVDTPIANAVVQIITDDGFCTGFLVTSTLALTASHCRFNLDDTLYIGTPNQILKNPPLRALAVGSQATCRSRAHPLSLPSLGKSSARGTILRAMSPSSAFGPPS